ncbi:TPA: PerC family transcriptional regulator [Enterobacter roggenkampii]
MVNDRKAEELEAKGLYRRAATRWRELMSRSYDDRERETYLRRMDKCLEAVKRPPVLPETFGDVAAASAETQKRMKIDQPKGAAFRLK